MNDKIRILIKVNGGFGTVLVRANYIYCLYDYLSADSEVSIDVVAHKSKAMNDAIFQGLDCINHYFPEQQWDEVQMHTYDLTFSLDMYPKIISYNNKRIKTSERLLTIVRKWQEFAISDTSKEYYRNIREAKPYEMRRLMNNHKSILNSADIDGILGIDEDYRLPVHISKDENDILEKFGLSHKEFITVQRGINPKLKSTESPKMWSQNNYETLITMLKESYPEKVIVQLGESPEHCKLLAGVDVNAVGKTDWDDLKVLLKHAALHIDGECGMVHLRKALNGGPSVVLFGITPIDYFGYEGNINIKGDGCSSFCGEINSGWEYRCLKGCEKAPCMESIDPQFVFERIKEYLCGNDNVCYQRDKTTLFSSNFNSIVKKYGSRIDAEYINSWLGKQTIYYYEECKVRVSQLKAHVFKQNRWTEVPLGECYAFKYVSGDNREIYQKNMLVRDKKLVDNIHSTSRFDELIASLDNNSQDMMIIVDEFNLIKDGQHRASWWMNKYGANSEIPALRIYLNPNN
ncbi:MAG: hypothetical protein K5773_05380 [Pseudobutyrivibrio sp.]|nr:hypothetical protein [Pseudobutyrivibrio sp.]